MREIKFNFVYGVDGQLETYFTKTFDFGEIENQSHWYFILDSPLMKDYSILAKRQYAGLKDKNGKEIYDGDFVEIILDEPRVYFIEWRTAGFWFIDYETDESFMFDPRMYELMVVGNIYESPDLLSEPVRNPNKLD